MMQIKVRNEIIDVPKYVIDKIPLIQTLSDTKSNEMIELEEISPSFLKHVIQHVNNQWKPLNLKKKLDEEFEAHVIKKFLGYLGMDQLIKNFYQPPEFLENRRVINYVYRNKSVLYGVTQNNEHILINETEAKKYICLASHGRVIGETSSSIRIGVIVSEYGRTDEKVISKQDLIVDIHGIYMYGEKYIKTFFNIMDK